MALLKIDIIEIYKHKRTLEYLAAGIGIVLAFLSFIVLFTLLHHLIAKDQAVLALVIAVSAFVSILPYMILQFILGKEQKALEEAYPAFLRDWAEAVSSGLGIIRALEITSKADYGALNKYLKKLVVWLSWGVPFPKAMQRFNEYFSFSPTIKRANEIILEIYKSGGDIVKTLRELADNVEKTRELYKDAISQVKSRVFVIHFIYLVLLAIAIIIKPVFVNMAGQKGLLGQGFDPSYFKELSLMMIISFAVSTSIMAAAIVGGNIADTIKHASIMFLAGLTAYVLFVLPPTINCELTPTGKNTAIVSVKLEGKPYTGIGYINGKKVTFNNGNAKVTYNRTTTFLKVDINTDFGKRECTLPLINK